MAAREEPDRPAPVPAAGPLGRRLTAEGPRVLLGKGEPADANALVITRRTAFVDPGADPRTWRADTPVRAWAASCGLGQRAPVTPGLGMLAAATARRTALLRRLRARRLHVLRLRLVPEWRLAVGLGHQFGANEFGLSLHGTYGWPILPASGLKGLAAAGAREEDADPAVVRRVLGGPRPAGQRGQTGQAGQTRGGGGGAAGQDPGADPGSGNLPAAGEPEDTRGAVVFLDALPAGEPATVHDDVITPHQHPYHTRTLVPGDGTGPAGAGAAGQGAAAGGAVGRGGAAGPAPADPNSATPDHEGPNHGDPTPGGRTPAVAPAEHHQPVLLPFLSVSGAFHADLAGPDRDTVEQAAAWLAAAGEAVGAGGRTTAGYGYFTCAEGSIE